MRSLIIIMFAILLTTCVGNSDTKIKELTFAVIPSDDMVQTTQYNKNISKYLEKELGIEIKFIKATDYTAVIEAMRSNKCHICILGPFSYLLASQNAGAEAIATIGLQSTGLYTYRSMLLTHPKSGLKSTDDIKKNAKSLQLAYSDPASTSGHLIPRTYISSLGLDPDKDFAGVRFSGSHVASLLSLRNAKFDLAGVSSESYLRLLANKQADSSDYVVLWQSDPILTDPFCVKNTLPTELKEKIRTALLEMHIKDTATFKQYIRYTYKGDKMRDSLIFMAAHDSAFNSLRVIARSVKSLNIR